MVRGLQVHLVGSDAEGAQREQTTGVLQRASRHVGLAADAQDVDVADPLDELVLLQGMVDGLQPETLAAHELLRRLVDVLEQEDLDVALREGGFHSRGL